jgi:hypothetical protein
MVRARTINTITLSTLIAAVLLTGQPAAAQFCRTPDPAPPFPEVRLVPAFVGIKSPVGLYSAGDGSGRFWPGCARFSISETA